MSKKEKDSRVSAAVQLLDNMRELLIKEQAITMMCFVSTKNKGLARVYSGSGPELVSATELVKAELVNGMLAREKKIRKGLRDGQATELGEEKSGKVTLSEV